MIKPLTMRSEPGLGAAVAIHASRVPGRLVGHFLPMNVLNNGRALQAPFGVLLIGFIFGAEAPERFRDLFILAGLSFVALLLGVAALFHLRPMGMVEKIVTMLWVVFLICFTAVAVWRAYTPESFADR